MNANERIQLRKIRTKRRVKAKLRAQDNFPRLSLFRGNRNLYAQIIDDKARITIVAAATNEKGFSDKENKSNIESAKKLGKLIAERALVKELKQVKFDRGCNLYHGKVKAFADAAREAGLVF